ncbi:hypothetical protein [Thermogemmatispora sp.]|jgi:hypothetical protein|uniref:hypothetical protein n=1 Tax=Thermogemmatispora sp. TaxID=1968838 RepID=UPI0035E41194
MPIYQQLKEPRILWVLFSGLFVNRFGDFVSLVLVLYLISEALPWGRPGRRRDGKKDALVC